MNTFCPSSESEKPRRQSWAFLAKHRSLSRVRYYIIVLHIHTVPRYTMMCIGKHMHTDTSIQRHLSFSCACVTRPPPQQSRLHILLLSSLKVRAHHHVRWSLLIAALPPTSFSQSRLSEWLNVLHLSKSHLQDLFASPGS